MKEVVPPVKVRIHFELINYDFDFLRNNKVPTAGFEPGSPGKRKTTNCEAPALPPAIYKSTFETFNTHLHIKSLKLVLKISSKNKF